MGILKKEDVDGNIRCLIQSSNILETVYNPTTKQLKIVFNSGRVYEYDKIDQRTYNTFESAESHGKHFHSAFKTLPSKRLGDVDVTLLLNEVYSKK